MEETLLKKMQTGEIRCDRCGLLIPFSFERGKEHTCPSFTIIDGKQICYYCYHPSDYKPRS